LRKYVHRDRKDSEIGTYVTYALVNKNHLDCIHRTKKAALLKGISMPKSHKQEKWEIHWLLLTETSDLMVKPYGYLSDLICFPVA
jgi:hypothetical protein